MAAPMRAAFLGLMTLVLPLDGAGMPVERAGDGCRCEAEAALGSAPAADEGPDRAGETCPPDCDGCSCCGGAPVAATVSPSLSTVAPNGVVSRSPWTDRAPPCGARSDVFRPPRA